MSGSIAPDAIYFNEFPTTGPAATVLGGEWENYDSPGNAGFGVRSPGQIQVVAEPTSTSGGNVLRITAQNVGGVHYSGGLKLLLPQTYGQYEMRVRVDVDPTEVTSGVVLMWPQSNEWPRDGELNWWETFDFRDTRTPVKSYVHRLRAGAVPPYDASDDELVVEVAHAGVDQSVWHKIVGTWTPEAITLSIDNGPEVLITDVRDFIPSVPMELTIQLDAWSDTPPASPITMDVDYVLVREWVPTPPLDSFPAERLPATVEMAFGASGPPISWDWVDVTDRLLAQTLSLTRGAPDEAGSIQPASVSFTLGNLDGALMPNKASSTWFPFVRRSTPVRVSVAGDVPGLTGDGALSARATTAGAPLAITGDIDIRVQMLPQFWAPGVEWSQTNGNRLLLGNTMRVAARWNPTGNQRSWVLHLYGAGWPALEWSPDGTQGAVVVGNPTATVAATKRAWLGVTLDVDNGQGQNVQRYWLWDAPGEPPADINDWLLVDEVVRSGTTSVHGGTAPLDVGGAAGQRSFRGRIYRFELRNGINGPIVAAPDFSAQPVGAAPFQDSTGQTWAMQSSAEISTRTTRFVGEVASIEPTWPFGDNHPTTPDVHPTESWVTVTATDVVRRLRTNQKPLLSPLRRHVTAFRWADKVTAYWPCEDYADAVSLASGLPAGSAIALSGSAAPATATGLPASAPLPVIAAGETGGMSGPIPTGPATRWAVEFVARFGTPGTATDILRWLADGTGTQWRVRAEPGAPADLRMQVLNASNTSIASHLQGASGFVGRWMFYRVDAEQSGGDVAWSFRWLNIETGGGGTSSGTYPGTLGRPTSIATTATGTADGLAVGHIIVHNGTLPASASGQISWLFGVDTAWVAESAAHRIWRLCTEEGIACEVIGDRTTFQDPRGVIALSEPMGPQTSRPFLDLLAEAAQLDMGVLLTRRGAPGFTYRTGASLRNQPVALALDGNENQIADVAPRYDDESIANDITVRTAGGSSARAVDESSVAEVGRYEADIEVVGVGGLNIQPAIVSGTGGLAAKISGQNLELAQRRLALSASPDIRWPTVAVDLAVAPELIPDALALEVGDRVQLRGLPVQSPADTVELQVRGVADRMSPTRWRMELATVPGAPYLT